MAVKEGSRGKGMQEFKGQIKTEVQVKLSSFFLLNCAVHFTAVDPFNGLQRDSFFRLEKDRELSCLSQLMH